MPDSTGNPAPTTGNPVTPVSTGNPTAPIAGNPVMPVSTGNPTAPIAGNPVMPVSTGNPTAPIAGNPVTPATRRQTVTTENPRSQLQPSLVPAPSVRSTNMQQEHSVNLATPGSFRLNNTKNIDINATHANMKFSSTPRQQDRNASLSTGSSQSLEETLMKVTQLHRIPQAKPETFKGEEGVDRTRYFLWENSFDALVDSVPVTSQQKLHLLYQYIDGKAKKVVEQLQYMVDDPESAYQSARKILKERFGNTAVIGTEFERKLKAWPKISPYDASALEEFGDFLHQVEIASDHIESLKVFNYSSQMLPLIDKLPSWFKAKWSEKVLRSQKEKGRDSYPSFKEFVSEVRHHAQRMNIPQLSHNQAEVPKDSRKTSLPFRPQSRTRRPPAQSSSVTTFISSSERKHASTPSQVPTPKGPDLSTNDQQRPKYCFYHNRSSHPTYECEQLSKLSYEERKQLLRSRNVCFNCLTSDKHIARDCNHPKPECKVCQGKHATILHDPSRYAVKNESSLVTKTTSSACSQVCGVHQPIKSCAKIVLLQVFHQDHPERRIPTYALLDDQSTDVFVTNALLDQLKVDSEDISLQVNTIVGTESVRTKKVHGLRIQDVDGIHMPISIQRAYSRERIPANRSNIATPDVARHWDHLNFIANSLRYSPDVAIGMLIGRNVPTAFQPLRVVYGNENEPWAEQYKFGWTIIGPACLNNDDEDSATVNHINVITTNGSEPDDTDNEGFPVTTRMRSQSKDVTSPQQLQDMMQLDYSELHYSRSVQHSEFTESIEDRRFKRILDEGVHVNNNGNWEMPLPFKTDEIQMPDNRTQCIKRLLSLKSKLTKKDQVRKDYFEFMQKILDRGHASRVPEEELKTDLGKVWYLPHFDIYHPKKPTQIRVVFDCSAVFQNHSLNQHLLQGPDQLNNLVGVLTRFRKEQTAVTCDIEQMYHSFYVNPEHRDYLRFLWYEDNNLNGPIVEYRMNVHLFGATSSPGVANYGLKKTAQVSIEKYGDQATTFLQREFYVDDGLKSFATSEEAIKTITEAQAICASRNLRLHKFASNDKKVLEKLPTDDRAKDLKELDLRYDTLPIQRSLGTYWSIESDTLGFRITLKDTPCTRRGILSTVSSVYDPIGMVAPVILQGKQILQDLCRDNIQWDQPVPDNIFSRWERWRSDLPLLENVEIDRCFKPAGFGEPTSAQIHSFSDASESGLGEVSYLRLENAQGELSVAFLMGKARVASIKPISIPRKELTAAVISVNVSSMLSRELDYQNIEEVFYTDSSAVLGYVNNDDKRFHTYVGNRVQHIRDRSRPDQWHHIPGKENPADEASRGISVKQLLQNTRWLRGPDFLWQHEAPEEMEVKDIDPDDIEVKRTATAFTTVTNEKSVHAKRSLEPDRFKTFSSFHRLKKRIALIQRMIERKRTNKEYNWRPQQDAFTVEELRVAEELIIKSVQETHYAEEINTLKNLKGNDNMFNQQHLARERNLSIKQQSSLYRLDPFLDHRQVIRVGGRLNQSDTDYSVKHPVVLPKNSHITQLIIRQIHEEQAHQGNGITLNALRQSGYWIISGRSTVRQFIALCVICRKCRARRQTQKMSDLPPERLTPAAPFTYSGMDVFGPFHVKEGRKEVKRWGLVFTCLSSRAIHLETLNKMDTDSFINGLRRFTCRRGKVRQLYSDQGTNFIGANNEFQSTLNEDTVKSFLLKNDCDLISFNFNVPSASHMGGVWERQIRTVRSTLTCLLKTQGTQLDDESLRTLFVEVENIVNSRPLSVQNLSEADSEDIITPNHLLTLKSKAVQPPPGVFLPPDVYSRKRWRRVQCLSEQFWRTWQKEYCHLLTKRQKWIKTDRNSQVGDIVLLCDEDLPRISWPLAKVVKVYPSSDGLVRKVQIMLTRGNRRSYLDRPIHKLILITSPE